MNAGLEGPSGRSSEMTNAVLVGCGMSQAWLDVAGEVPEIAVVGRIPAMRAEGA